MPAVRLTSTPRRSSPAPAPATRLQDRNCYCTGFALSPPVDCLTCRCTGCPRPAVGRQDECAADRIKENPYYLSAATGTCVR